MDSGGRRGEEKEGWRERKGGRGKGIVSAPGQEIIEKDVGGER